VIASEISSRNLNNDLTNIILDNSEEGISVLDKDGCVLYANATTLKNFGYTFDDFIGIKARDLTKSGNIDANYSDWVLENKQSISGWQTFISSNKIRRPIFSKLKPFFDDNGELSYILATNREMKKFCSKFSKNCISEDILNLAPTYIKKTRTITQDSIIYESKAMEDIISQISHIANTDASVLLTGETGTGKDVLANYIHNSCIRKNHKFVRVNSAAVPEALLESEFFGYEKNSFTGAISSKKGLLEEADKGTFFLDEVNSLPLIMQGKLLNALETKSIRRIGSAKQINSDFRLISATNQDLKQLVSKNEFRLDLYYRLNVININIPPLRERKDDIIPLVKYFLEYYCNRYKREISFSNSVLDDFIHYDWPGNIRELKNMVERLVLSSGNSIELKCLPDNAFSTESYFNNNQRGTEIENSSIDQNQFDIYYDEKLSLKENLANYEIRILKQAMHKYKTTTEAAVALGVSQPTISRKLSKYLHDA
jgi:PAS domain S-box-containing protein